MVPLMAIRPMHGALAKANQAMLLVPLIPTLSERRKDENRELWCE